LISSSGVSRRPPSTIETESSASDAGSSWPSDAQRRDQPCRYRHQLDDEVVADHRGDERMTSQASASLAETAIR
jgi:hypothetical protein